MTGPLAPLFAQVLASLIDAHPGPMDEHDPLCRTFSGWPDDREKGCNCSVARNKEARAALSSIERHVQDMEKALNPVSIAQAFHENYERLAPTFGYQTRTDSAVPWAEVPEQNRALMVATVAEVLAALPAREKGTETNG